MTLPALPNPPSSDGAVGRLGPNGAFCASVTETMDFLGRSRPYVYELINAGELVSYLEGSSRKITWASIYDRLNRLIAAEAARRERAA